MKKSSGAWGAHGGCFQDLEICKKQTAQGGGGKKYTRYMTWTCLFLTITKKITASFELRVVDRRVFHHLSR